MAQGIGGLDRIQARIGQIEARISALTDQSASAPEAAAVESSFAASLARAGGAPAPVPAGTSGSLPPAMPAGGLRALPPPPGWVTPMPVTPGAAAAAPAGVARWDGIIQKYAAQYNVSADLVRAVMSAESAGDPRVVSRAGAMGLMQLMPANVREAGVTDPFDPDQNIRAGVAQLREHLDRYKGDVPLALAAYNAGPGNVAKYNGIPPFRETQNYVRKIMSRVGG